MMIYIDFYVAVYTLHITQNVIDDACTYVTQCASFTVTEPAKNSIIAVVYKDTYLWDCMHDLYVSNMYTVSIAPRHHPYMPVLSF